MLSSKRGVAELLNSRILLTVTAFLVLGEETETGVNARQCSLISNYRGDSEALNVVTIDTNSGVT